MHNPISSPFRATFYVQPDKAQSGGEKKSVLIQYIVQIQQKIALLSSV